MICLMDLEFYIAKIFSIKKKNLIYFSQKVGLNPKTAEGMAGLVWADKRVTLTGG